MKLIDRNSIGRNANTLSRVASDAANQAFARRGFVPESDQPAAMQNAMWDRGEMADAGRRKRGSEFDAAVERCITGRQGGGGARWIGNRRALGRGVLRLGCPSTTARRAEAGAESGRLAAAARRVARGSMVAVAATAGIAGLHITGRRRKRNDDRRGHGGHECGTGQAVRRASFPGRELKHTHKSAKKVHGR